MGEGRKRRQMRGGPWAEGGETTGMGQGGEEARDKEQGRMVAGRGASLASSPSPVTSTVQSSVPTYIRMASAASLSIRVGLTTGFPSITATWTALKDTDDIINS